MKKFKSLFILLFILGILTLSSKQVHAATKYETEPNDTIDQAESITRNTQTAAQVAAGNTNGSSVVSGSLNRDEDVDWYKVTLYSNQDNFWDYAITNTTSGNVRLEVYDSTGSLVGNNSFDYSPLTTERTFRVTVPTTSTYYLKISRTDTGSTLFYGFTIGGPLYFLSSFEVNFPRITLNANTSWTQQIVLNNNTAIPRGAIAYEAVLDGGTMSSTSSREIRCESNNAWQRTSMTPWRRSLPVTNTYSLRQTWEVRYNAWNSTTSFSPRIIFYYVYPRMPMDEQF